MTTYCRHGHAQYGAVLYDPVGGGPARCIACRTPLDGSAETDWLGPWPLVLGVVILVLLAAIGWLFWWTWLARH